MLNTPNASAIQKTSKHIQALITICVLVFRNAQSTLSLCNNGQVEPTSIYEVPDPDERTHDGDDSESIDTSVRQQLSGSGNDTLKRQFLDDVAEVAAKEDGACVVARTAMREREDDVTILIARNTPFEPSDFEFFDKFSDLVSTWSSHQHTPPAIETGSRIVEWTNYFWDIFSAKNGRSQNHICGLG